jgi:predicted DNA-binding transcriptional regulator YafY
MATFAEAIRADMKNVREVFIARQSAKAVKRKPKRTGVKLKRGTLFSVRNKRVTIQEGALRRVQIIIVYTKVTTGEQKRYVVCPYSYRYRKLRRGWRKMLFAWDVDDKHIKGFVLENIRNVALTDNKFKPKWEVEF